jgi:hypothetical protein
VEILSGPTSSPRAGGTVCQASPDLALFQKQQTGLSPSLPKGALVLFAGKACYSLDLESL